MTKIVSVIFSGLRTHTLLGRPLGTKAFIAEKPAQEDKIMERKYTEKDFDNW